MSNSTTAGVANNSFGVDLHGASFIGGGAEIGNANAHGGSEFGFGGGDPVTAGVANNSFSVDAHGASFIGGGFDLGNANADAFHHFDFIPL